MNDKVEISRERIEELQIAYGIFVAVNNYNNYRMYASDVMLAVRKLLESIKE